MNANSRIKCAQPAADNYTGFRRRKVRKGTQSCWECKRRKVRCRFVSAADAICEGCKIRQTRCVGQDIPEESVPLDVYKSRHHQLYDKLARLEAVVGRIAEKVDITDDFDDGCDVLPPLLGSTRRESPYSSTRSQALGEQVATSANFCDRGAIYCPSGGLSTKQRPFVDTSAFDAGAIRRADSRDGSGYDLLSHTLLKAWPNPHELEIILDLPGDVTALVHGTMCAPFSTMLNQGVPTVRESLQLPPIGSHPVPIARKLLMLATYLQSLSPTSTRVLDELGVDWHTTMSYAVKRAHDSVTGNDELLGSVEGIECVMIESMYQNNAGELRSAWHLIRRGMLIAQMMGLHRGTSSQALIFLDSETRARVEPEYMWFRLVSMDRYLSMMLGMLQGTPSNSFADCQVLERSPPTERMQRMDCAAAGYILQRNEEGLHDTATTHMIDQLLQKSAASLPQSWWLVPDLESNFDDETVAVGNVLRAMHQLTHYHLVLQLHLPHLLRPHKDHAHDYSKIMAVNASRELLLRYTSLHGAHSFTSFCRGISFLALISCTTICIIHIDAKRQRQDCADSDGGLLHLLHGERERDRILMETTLDCMKHRAHESRDPIASKTAFILDHLLSVEEDTDLGGKYVANTSIEEAERGTECAGDISGCGQYLQIHIPCIGTIKLERGKASSGLLLTALPPCEDKVTITSTPTGHVLHSMQREQSNGWNVHNLDLMAVLS